jgi:hypothetical protein
MSQATESIAHHALITLTADEIRSLADRLFSRGVSVITTYGPREKGDLICASRVIRELMQRYELSTGCELQAIGCLRWSPAFYAPANSS